MPSAISSIAVEMLEAMVVVLPRPRESAVLRGVCHGEPFRYASLARMFDDRYTAGMMVGPGPGAGSPLGSLPDALLAARAAAGRDPEAERELCARFGPRVRLYGLRHMRDAAAAADLVQDVLLVLLDRLRAGAVRDPQRIASFVLGVCRVAARDGARDAARRGALLERFGQDLPSAHPVEKHCEDSTRLDSCLDALAPRERVVLQLTFYAERSSEEIAAELGTTAGNVRVIRHRALDRLRACMGAEGPP